MWKLIPSFWAAFSASPLVRPQSASTGKPRAYNDQGKGGHLTCLIVDSQGLPSKQVLVTRQQGRCQRFQHPAIPLTSWLPHIHLWNKPLFIFHSIFTITYLLSFHGCCCYSKPCLAKLLWFSSSVQIFAEPVFDKRFTHPTLQHSACQSACHLETVDQRQDLYLS